MVADLERFCATCCRLPNGDLSYYCLVVLSVTMHAKRPVVVRRVVAMSHFRSAQIEGLAYKPSDRATSQQRAVWRTSLATGRQDDSAKMRCLARFASDKTTRRKGDNKRYRLYCRYRASVPNQPP
jgi:hypothetical protein